MFDVFVVFVALFVSGVVGFVLLRYCVCYVANMNECLMWLLCLLCCVASGVVFAFVVVCCRVCCSLFAVCCHYCLMWCVVVCSLCLFVVWGWACGSWVTGCVYVHHASSYHIFALAPLRISLGLSRHDAHSKLTHTGAADGPTRGALCRSSRGAMCCVAMCVSVCLGVFLSDCVQDVCVCECVCE
jgi:hypothetical protein